MALEINAKPLNMRAGSQSCSAECTQKVAVMLSKAILSQAAVAALLEVILPEGGPVDRSLKAGERNLQDVVVSPRLLETMRIKLIDSMEWSHLARDRIKEMILHEKSESLPFAGHTARPAAETDTNPNDAPIKRNGMPSDLAESQRLFIGEFSQIAAPHVIAASRSQRGERGQTRQSFTEFMLCDENHLIAGDGRNFTGVASAGLGFESNNILSAKRQLADQPGPLIVLPTESGPAATSNELSDRSSSTLPDAAAASDGQRLVDIDNGSKDSLRIGSKRQREEPSEENLLVEYQELKPGSPEAKNKGIPDDGHKYWKKYGAKDIQHYKYRRSYYKCSLWDKCKSSKMVTPTNNNPSIFEVVYYHQHTCSATEVRSRRRRSFCNTTAHSTEVIEVDINAAGERHCLPDGTPEEMDIDISLGCEQHCPPDAEVGSPDAAPHMAGDSRTQIIEICNLINMEHGEVIARVPAIEGALTCDIHLPSSTTFSEEIFSKSDCASAKPEVIEVDISALSEPHCLPDAIDPAVIEVDVSAASECHCLLDATPEVVEVVKYAAGESHCLPEASLEVNEVDISAVSKCECPPDAEAGSPDAVPHMPGDNWFQISEISKLINVDHEEDVIDALPVVEVASRQNSLPTWSWSSSKGIFTEEFAPYDVTERDFAPHEDDDLDGDPFSEPLLWTDEDMNAAADSVLALVEAM